ncbi:MAG: hypothetical protein EXR81_07050 [Gammaproteobacteria bacterium]|nr:hypothetical protein [Gammaproteobacteria bacterium]
MNKEGVPDSWYNDLHWIMMQESGGRVGVRCSDSNSTARGLFQLNKLNYKLNPNGEASFGNGVEECQGGIRYIKSRYHTAAAARQFWEKHKWY